MSNLIELIFGFLPAKVGRQLSPADGFCAQA
jgi:hypothetical protein